MCQEEDSSENAREWERLEEHFRQHASIVTYFRNANAAAVLQMLKTGINDAVPASRNSSVML